MNTEQSIDFLFSPTDGAGDGMSPAEELSLDMYERDDAIVVRALVPGIPPEHISIALEGDQLTISGTRIELEEITHDRFFHRECAWGLCARSLMIPGEIDTQRVRAHVNHGVLIVELPKRV